MTNTNPNSQTIFDGGQRVLFYSLVSLGGVFLIVLALPFFRVSSLADEGVREVEVVLSEFTIQPSSFAFDAGDQVRFVIENRGKVAHEFRLTSGSSATAHAEGGHDGHDGSAAGSDEQGDMWLLVNPNQTEILEVTFDEHSTFDLVACMLPGHYEAGMTSPLTIAGVMMMATETDDHATETDDHATDDHDMDDMDDHATETDDHATDDHDMDDHATDG